MFSPFLNLVHSSFNVSNPYIAIYATINEPRTDAIIVTESNLKNPHNEPVYTEDIITSTDTMIATALWEFV